MTIETPRAWTEWIDDGASETRRLSVWAFALLHHTTRFESDFGAKVAARAAGSLRLLSRAAQNSVAQVVAQCV
jgi:hypothetical protein